MKRKLSCLFQERSLFLPFFSFLVLISVTPIFAREAETQTPETDQGALTENNDSMEKERAIEKEINELRQSIDEQSLESEQLEDRMKVLKTQIRKRQKESVTLENEIANLTDQIESSQLEIEKKTNEVKQYESEIGRLEDQIQEKEKEISIKQNRLKELLILLYEFEEKTPLEIAMSNESFSDFFSTVAYTEELQKNIQQSLVSIRETKKSFEDVRIAVFEKKSHVEEKKQDLEIVQADLSSQSSRKDILLEETEESEEKFQALLIQAKAEFDEANSAIIEMEKVMRKKLREKRAIDKEEGESTGLEFDGSFNWPSSGREITAGFKDPDYPFRYLFEHPAIDIRQSQGTPVKAAANGIVGIAKNGGATGYSYIMIIHDQGLSTVYGHLSRIDVSVDDDVLQGQIIGLSGGMPGTPGAGRLTTGPHVHFEIRLEGIPVNPLNYLQ